MFQEWILLHEMIWSSPEILTEPLIKKRINECWPIFTQNVAIKKKEKCQTNEVIVYLIMYSIFVTKQVFCSKGNERLSDMYIYVWINVYVKLVWSCHVCTIHYWSYVQNHKVFHSSNNTTYFYRYFFKIVLTRKPLSFSSSN